MLGKGAPVRLMAPTTSNVPVEAPAVLGCVSVLPEATVMSLLVSARTPLTVLSLFIAMPPASLLVRLLKVVAVVPPIVWPAPPLKVVVPAPGVNVPPLLVQLPVTLVFVPPVKTPVASNRLPFTFSVAGPVKPPAVIVRSFVVTVTVLPPAANVPPLLLTITLLKVWLAAVPLIDWVPPPLKLTVLPVGVNVPPLFVQLPGDVHLRSVTLQSPACIDLHVVESAAADEGAGLHAHQSRYRQRTRIGDVARARVIDSIRLLKLVLPDRP